MYYKKLSLNIQRSFKCNKSIAECFLLLVVALIKVRTVNLVELSQGFESEALPESRYRRIQRFLKNAKLSIVDLGLFILQRFLENHDMFYLSMGRSNWQYGKSNINIFMISMVYNSAALPLYWHLLNKKSFSNTKERKKIMQEFIDNYG